jgi:hypothetical protein
MRFIVILIILHRTVMSYPFNKSLRKATPPPSHHIDCSSMDASRYSQLHYVYIPVVLLVLHRSCTGVTLAYIKLIKKTKWLCPTCTELSPTRHWSVRRHIQRKHDGVGEPISFNTYQTRDQMHMASSVSDSYATSISNTTQPNSMTNNLGDLLRYQNNPFRFLVHHETMPIPQSNDTWMLKLQEIVRLSYRSRVDAPQFVSNILVYLSSLMHFMDETRWESVIDEILRDLRSR